MKVKFKKTNPNAILPRYANSGDNGLDLVSTEAVVAGTNLYDVLFICKTGIAVEIPEGYVGLVFPRSSISKTDLTLANSVGVIDSSYRGEIELRFKYPNAEREMVTYKQGDKIAQLVIVPCPVIEVEEVEELSDTIRGDQGFGSTDKPKLGFTPGWEDGVFIGFD